MIDLTSMGKSKAWALLIIVVFVVVYLTYNINVIANCDGDVVRGMVSFICLGG